MPLQKAYTSRAGFTGDYWVLGEVNIRIDKDGNHLISKVNMYKSANDYNAGVKPVEVQNRAFYNDNNPIKISDPDFQVIMQKVYQAIIDKDAAELDIDGNPQPGLFSDATIVP